MTFPPITDRRTVQQNVKLTEPEGSKEVTLQIILTKFFIGVDCPIVCVG